MESITLPVAFIALNADFRGKLSTTVGHSEVSEVEVVPLCPPLDNGRVNAGASEGMTPS